MLFTSILLVIGLTTVTSLMFGVICYLSFYLARKKKVISMFLHFFSLILVYIQAIVADKFDSLIWDNEHWLVEPGIEAGPRHPGIFQYTDIFEDLLMYVIYVELILILFVFIVDLLIISLVTLSQYSIKIKAPLLIIAIIFAIAIPQLIFSEFYYFISNAGLAFNKDIPFWDCIYASYNIVYSIPVSPEVNSVIQNSIVEEDSRRFLVILHVLFSKLVEFIVVGAIVANIIEEIKNKTKQSISEYKQKETGTPSES